MAKSTEVSNTFSESGLSHVLSASLFDPGKDTSTSKTGSDLFDFSKPQQPEAPSPDHRRRRYFKQMLATNNFAPWRGTTVSMQLHMEAFEMEERAKAKVAAARKAAIAARKAQAAARKAER